MICIGPQIVACRDESDSSAGVAFTGWALEFATSTLHINIPIYRNVHSSNIEQVDLDDLVFHERFQNLDMMIPPHLIAHTAKGRFLPMGSYACALYSQFNQARHITQLLEDIRNVISISRRFCLPDFTRPDLVSWELQKMGFELVSTFSYGRIIMAGLAWTFPQDRSNSDPSRRVDVYQLEFRPSPSGELKNKSWITKEKSRFIDLLWELARSICNGDFTHALSDAGKDAVLNSFEWTPLARMSAKEARLARIRFISDHMSLVTQPKALADALRTNGLYSENTTLHQIAKFLPALIDAATRTKS